jgi:hypothetical protein
VGRTITLNDVVVLDWTVNVRNRSVTVSYAILEASGKEYEKGIAVFWDTLPTPTPEPDGRTPPLPSNYYELPAKYRTVLADLTSEMRTALLKLIA